MKLLVGPPNSGKSEHVVARFAEAISRETGRSLLVVPSREAVRCATEQLAKALAVPELPRREASSILTFNTLCLRILKRSGHSATIVKSVERDRIFRELIEQLSREGALDYFQQTALMPGTAGSIGDFIAELCQSGTAAGDFARISRTPKDRDIARIFRSYEETLVSRSLVDPLSLGLLALTVLEQDRLRRPFRRVFVDGFDRYSRVQVRLLSALSRLGAEVLVAFTYEEGRAVHMWHDATFVRLKEAATHIEHLSSYPKTETAAAASRLMTYEAHSLTVSKEGPASAITVLSAPDRASEVRETAREVKRLVLDEHFTLSEITLVCRSLENYKGHLRQIFREVGVPLSIRAPELLSENNLTSAILRLIELSGRSFRRRALIETLRCPYFDFSSIGLDTRSIDFLDRISIGYKVTRRREQWLDAVAAAGENRNPRVLPFREETESEKQNPEFKQSCSALAESLSKLFDLVTPEPAAARPNHLSWVRGVLELLRVEDCIAKLKAAADEINSIGSREEQAWNGLKQVLSPAELMPESQDSGRSVEESQQNVRWDDFLRDFKTSLDDVVLRDAERSGQAVIVQDLRRPAHGRFRAVFVLGLIEGEFPARLEETAPYTHVEREELRRVGIDLTESSNDAGSDVHQFYILMSRATERLYLSYSRTDLSGGELLRSYLIDEVAAISQVREVRINPRISDVSFEPDRAASMIELALAASRALRDHDEDVPQLRDACGILEAEFPGWKNTVRCARIERRRLSRTEHGAYGGIISVPDLLHALQARFGGSYVWSATQINDYGICPFRFFARHVLRLASTDEPVEGFLAQQIGGAYHRALQRIYSRLKSEGIAVTLVETGAEGAAAQGLSDAARISVIVEEEIDQVLEQMAAGGEVRRDALFEFEKAELTRRVMLLLRAEAEWNFERPAQPVYFERGFGRAGRPPLVVGQDGEPIQLKGIIDRIDQRDDGLVVIDYKTGATTIGYREALMGRNLQMPIYVMAVEQVLQPGSRVAGAYYLHINSCKKGSELRREGDPKLAIGSVVSHARDFIRDYVGRVRRGRFPVTPNGPCPVYCEYNLMCRIQSLRVSADEDRRELP